MPTPTHGRAVASRGGPAVAVDESTPQPWARARAAGGFTLLEVIVSIGVMTVVMTALTSFLVSTNAVTNHQRARQVAVQLATDGSERVRGMSGPDIITGRDANSVDLQWLNRPPGVDAHFVGTEIAADPAAAAGEGTTSAAKLRTDPRTVTVRALRYQQYWFVGRCWQRRAVRACDTANKLPDDAERVEFFRVVVAVTWPSRNCGGTQCLFAVSTLVNSNPRELLFPPELPP